MKNFLFILSLLFLSSCGLFEENHREVKYDLADGSRIKLSLTEIKYPLSERTLAATGIDYNLKGRNCEDIELKNFSNELWAEIVKRNNLSEINSGVISFFRQQGEAVPDYCRYFYSKEKNGDWIAKE